MGRRYDHQDPQMALYKETTRIFSEVCSTVNGAEIDLCPWLRFFPNKNFEKLTLARNMLDNLVDVELKAARVSEFIMLQSLDVVYLVMENKAFN